MSPEVLTTLGRDETGRTALDFGADRASVREALARVEPLDAELRSHDVPSAIKRLWQSLALGALTKANDIIYGRTDAKPSVASAYAVVAGIATDKLLLLDNRPTVITATVHEHRFDLGEFAHRLAAVAGRVASPLPPARPATVIDISPSVSTIPDPDADNHASPGRSVALNQAPTASDPA